MKDIAIYGAGGFGHEIACLINHINAEVPKWNLVGYFDDGLSLGTTNKYGSVLGGIAELNRYKKNLSIVIAIATPYDIKSIVDQIQNPLIDFPNLIAPNAIIFDEEAITMQRGNIVFFGSRLSCNVEIGSFNLFNGLVSLGHDVKMGDFNVLQPSVRISGSSSVGNENFFGVQAIILQGLTIGNNTRIGANSVVMRNTTDGDLYFGNPAKKVIL